MIGSTMRKLRIAKCHRCCHVCYRLCKVYPGSPHISALLSYARTGFTLCSFEHRVKPSSLACITLSFAVSWTFLPGRQHNQVDNPNCSSADIATDLGAIDAVCQHRLDKMRQFAVGLFHGIVSRGLHEIDEKGVWLTLTSFR
jgi:hypothetical protein